MQLAYEKQSRPLRHLFWDTEDLWTVNIVDAYRLLELSWSKWLIICLPIKKQGMTALIHGFPTFGYDSLINNPIKNAKTIVQDPSGLICCYCFGRDTECQSVMHIDWLYHRE